MPYNKQNTSNTKNHAWALLILVYLSPLFRGSANSRVHYLLHYLEAPLFVALFWDSTICQSLFWHYFESHILFLVQLWFLLNPTPWFCLKHAWKFISSAQNLPTNQFSRQGFATHSFSSLAENSHRVNLKLKDVRPVCLAATTFLPALDATTTFFFQFHEFILSMPRNVFFWKILWG